MSVYKYVKNISYKHASFTVFIFGSHLFLSEGLHEYKEKAGKKHGKFDLLKYIEVSKSGLTLIPAGIHADLLK